MRKLVLILLAFFAVVTFIRAFDNSSGIHSGDLHASEVSDFKAASIPSPGF